MSEAWLAGYEEWAAGAEYRVRELLDSRRNADTGALEFKVRWEDELKMNPDTGERLWLRWSDPQYDSWEPEGNIPSVFITRWLCDRARDRR